MGTRNLHIGGNMIGGAAVLGDNNVVAARLDGAAQRLGAGLAGALTADEAAFLIEAACGDPPPPLLAIESNHDPLLAMPWELMRPGDRFAVRDGRLDVARSVPATAAPGLSPPAAPMSLLVNVSAPEGSGLDYERESYFILRALHEHGGIELQRSRQDFGGEGPACT